MRAKLDENLGPQVRRVFLDAGHDVHSVDYEGLRGQPDLVIYAVCRIEQRCLVTLDSDLTDDRAFPRAGTAGIILLKPGKRDQRRLTIHLARNAAELARYDSPAGKLWILEPAGLTIVESEA